VPKKIKAEFAAPIELVLKPRLAVVQGKVSVTSLAVAEHFGMLHKNVLRDIEQILKDAPVRFRRLNFELTFREIPGPNGAVRKSPYYRMTRDGFTLLAMGFTGKEAFRWKIAYIEAFSGMEQNLLTQRTDLLRDRTGGPVRSDGMDSPLFNELLRALGNQQVAEAVTMTYLLEAGADKAALQRSVREISRDLQARISRGSVWSATNRLEKRGLLRINRGDGFNKSRFEVLMEAVVEFFEAANLDVDVLSDSLRVRQLH
jgi:Rha family phage regulatory protein